MDVEISLEMNLPLNSSTFFFYKQALAQKQRVILTV